MRKLTLAEIASYVEEIEDEPEATNQRWAGNTKGYAEWLRSLQPSDLLEHAIEGTL